MNRALAQVFACSRNAETPVREPPPSPNSVNSCYKVFLPPALRAKVMTIRSSALTKSLTFNQKKKLVPFRQWVREPERHPVAKVVSATDSLKAEQPLPIDAADVPQTWVMRSLVAVEQRMSPRIRKPRGMNISANLIHQPCRISRSGNLETKPFKMSTCGKSRGGPLWKVMDIRSFRALKKYTRVSA